jgi:hypothetical protein
MSSLSRTRLVLVIAAIGVVVALALVYFVPFQRAGSSASECRALPVAARIAHVAMDQERGVAYLAYVDVPKSASARAPRGTVMLMDLNVAEPRVRAALVTDPPDFLPTALTLYAPAQGPRRLFVIDRESAVQIFEQLPSGAFERVKTVQDEQFADLAEIAATGPESFYVRIRPHGWFGASRSSVLLYDGKKTSAAPADALETAATDGAYINTKAHKRLEVLERDDATDLQLCPAAAATPSS